MAHNNNNDDLMIKATGLTHYYGPQIAVEDVNFGVKKGEVLGFLGPVRSQVLIFFDEKIYLLRPEPRVEVLTFLDT